MESNTEAKVYRVCFSLPEGGKTSTDSLEIKPVIGMDEMNQVAKTFREKFRQGERLLYAEEIKKTDKQTGR